MQEATETSLKLARLRSMLSLIVTLIVVGILLWLINTQLPMDGKIKNILNIVVVVCVVVWLMSAFGLFHHLHDVPVPQVR